MGDGVGGVGVEGHIRVRQLENSRRVGVQKIHVNVRGYSVLEFKIYKFNM